VVPDAVVESIMTIPELGRPERNTMGSWADEQKRNQGISAEWGGKKDAKNEGKKDGKKGAKKEGKKDKPKGKGDTGKDNIKGSTGKDKPLELTDSSEVRTDVEPEHLKIGVAGECVKLTLTMPLDLPGLDLSEHTIITGFGWACEHVRSMTMVASLLPSSSSLPSISRCSNLQVHVTVLRGHKLEVGEQVLLFMVPHTPCDDVVKQIEALRSADQLAAPAHVSPFCAIRLEKVVSKGKSHLQAGQHAAVDFSVCADDGRGCAMVWLDAETTAAETARVALRRTVDGCIVAVGIVLSVEG
jgi:hypothetical protein